MDGLHALRDRHAVPARHAAWLLAVPIALPAGTMHSGCFPPTDGA